MNGDRSVMQSCTHMQAPESPSEAAYPEHLGSINQDRSTAAAVDSSQPPGLTAEPVSDTFIVRFREYKPAAEHQAALLSFGSLRDWHWVPRDNAAARFPTDFGLLSGSSSSFEALKVQLPC